MIRWLIVLGILALLLGLLLSPLVFTLDYDDPRDCFFWRLSWLGISLTSSENKGIFRKRSGASPKKKKTKTKEKKTPENAEQFGRKRRWDMIQSSLSILPKPLRLLWKGLSIRHLVIGAQVGRFDARECALAYGAVNGMVYAAVGLLGSAMRIQADQITVQCAFGQERTRWVIRGKLHFCLLSGILALGSFAIGYVMQKSRQEHAGEAAAAAEKEHAAAR